MISDLRKAIYAHLLSFGGFEAFCVQAVSTPCPRTEAVLYRLDHNGCTLIAVGRGNNAVTTREAATEIVSVALWALAYQADVNITRTWVDSQLERLRAHPQPCRCSEPCGLVGKVTANRVHWTATSWQRQYRRAGVLARR
jgi:hypothetical protein